ncbi:PREDICTED: uncharacterized protein LOC109232544 [Nicotiana attenuata]|uniref:uncharacterized protein LOC109232544 n=1 Tax=Nicotiana attenuata TaxID=49451 RepID=UPI00090497EB|nr:PREDICTED: uncharacterized protein LOC109232544 [Nicotiana attenuata]
MVDENTERKSGLNFAKLLVEVEMNANLDSVTFKNERGNLVEQKVVYDWKSTLCKYCDKYGHDEINCRNKKGQHNAAHEKNGKDIIDENVVQYVPLVKGRTETNTNEGNVAKQGTKESVRITPWRTGRNQGKQQQQTGYSQQQKVVSSNTFQVLNREKMFGGWPHITNLAAHYNGRIWITWRLDYYIVVPLVITTHIVTCAVHNIPLKLDFVISFVYAFNTREDRKELWDILMNYSTACNQPWIIAGDFNSVLNPDDTVGGNPITWLEIVDFHHCVDTCGLIELPHVAQRYTWNDRSSSGQRIFFKY